jgi:hypothetical protein
VYRAKRSFEAMDDERMQPEYRSINNEYIYKSIPGQEGIAGWKSPFLTQNNGVIVVISDILTRI